MIDPYGRLSVGAAPPKRRLDLPSLLARAALTIVGWLPDLSTLWALRVLWPSERLYFEAKLALTFAMFISTVARHAWLSRQRIPLYRRGAGGVLTLALLFVGRGLRAGHTILRRIARAAERPIWKDE
jgi:hypothetical protein